MKKNKVFIACDTKNINRVKKIIVQTQTKKLNIGYKFGLEFFYSKFGRQFISKIKKKNLFLDTKINDIPNTSIGAINSIKDLKNIKYITVHINGGFEMLKAIKKVSGKIKVLGVTVLTSLNNKSLKQIGYNKSIKKIIIQQAILAKSAGLDGVVCSPKEAGLVKNICKNMEIVTPGIRFGNDKLQDQKRITSPIQAYENGATAIVIGRSITKGNIKNNLKKLINSLK